MGRTKKKHGDRILLGVIVILLLLGILIFIVLVHFEVLRNITILPVFSNNT